MPYRVMALYRNEVDDAFRQRYAEHAALCRVVPGLVALRSGRIVGSPQGRSQFTWYSELEFADETEFKTALRTPEMAATGNDVAKFAPDVSVLFVQADG